MNVKQQNRKGNRQIILSYNMRARTKRNSNIEIIKLIAVFLIILSSALPYGATYRGETVYVNLKLLRGVRCK